MARNTNMKKREEVLEALHELCKKFNVEMGACSCCDGWWIDDLDKGANIIAHHLRAGPDGVG